MPILCYLTRPDGWRRPLPFLALMVALAAADLASAQDEAAPAESVPQPHDGDYPEPEVPPAAEATPSAPDTTAPPKPTTSRGPSAEQRLDKSWYGAARLPAVTTLGSAKAGEIGAEAGAYLTPDVLLIAVGQTGYLGDSEVTSGQVYHVGATARVFIGNAFFLSSGLLVRRVSLNLNAAHMQIPSTTGSNVAAPYSTYGQAVAESLGLPLTLGWQWQTQNFSIGFEAISVFLPFTVLHTHGTFDNSYAYDDHSRAEPGQKAVSLSHTPDLSLGRLTIGASF